MTNCIIYGNGGGDFSPGTYSNISYIFCARTNGSTFINAVGVITNDPMFVNGTNGDFHLQKGSSCIDAVRNMPGVTIDLDGKPRPLGGGTGRGINWDIGCYEYSPKGMWFKGY